MNTPTLMAMIIFIAGLIYLILVLFRLRARAIKEDNKEGKIAVNILLIFIFLLSLFSIITAANIYGWGRLPLINEIRNRLPQDFTPNPSPVKPSTNGAVQPPSSPTVDEHAKAMEKLKRDGF